MYSPNRRPYEIFTSKGQWTHQYYSTDSKSFQEHFMKETKNFKIAFKLMWLPLPFRFRWDSTNARIHYHHSSNSKVKLIHIVWPHHRFSGKLIKSVLKYLNCMSYFYRPCRCDRRKVQTRTFDSHHYTCIVCIL